MSASTTTENRRQSTAHGEQRAHERAAIEVEVNLASEHDFYTGITSDLSEGGVFAATHVPAKLGERLAMDLRLPGCAETYRVEGIVRWVRDLRMACDGVSPGFGMQFTALPPDAIDAIQRFVAQPDSIFFET